MLRQLLLASHRGPASFAAADFEFFQAALAPPGSSSAPRSAAATVRNLFVSQASRAQCRQCPAECAASPLRRNCSKSTGSDFPEHLLTATAKPLRLHRGGAPHNLQTRRQERGVYFYSTSSSEKPTAPLSGRRRLRFIDKASLTPNTNENNNRSNISSSSSCDFIVSCGTHGGGDLGRRSLQLEGKRLSVLPRSRRHAIQRKPLLPVEPRNLRQPVRPTRPKR